MKNKNILFLILSCLFFLIMTFGVTAQELWSKRWEEITELSQLSRRIVDTIGLKPGMVVAEIGFGNRQPARQVGDLGKVCANDIEPKTLEFMRKYLREENFQNTIILKGQKPDPRFLNSGGSQIDGSTERTAMKKLDFVIGKWEGEGWLLVGPDQRYPFSVAESYSYRCNGLIVDGEGKFRPGGAQEDTETPTMYGLGMIYFDRQSGEYRMWHYGGTGSGFVFTQKIEIDIKHRTLHYINVDAKGETYMFSFVIDDEGILTARTERQKPDSTWYVSMEFRMRKIQLKK